jgi:hypothetical protein
MGENNSLRSATQAPVLSINDWHRIEADKCRSPDHPIVRRLECNDGFVMSVQASAGHYCSPRENRAWPYSAFEIGYPSSKEQLIAKFAETPGKYTDTVYGYVPTGVVESVIKKHGGIKKA